MPHPTVGNTPSPQEVLSLHAAAEAYLARSQESSLERADVEHLLAAIDQHPEGIPEFDDACRRAIAHLGAQALSSDAQSIQASARRFAASPGAADADDLIEEYLVAKARPERDLLHSDIIRRKLEEGTSSASPVLIFTAGAPGSGKSTVVGALEAQGMIDTHSFMVIDPDAFKEMLPEYGPLKAAAPEQAASVVHPESGDIQEKLFFEGLKVGKNMIVDGTLRATDYFTGIISHVRQNYPHYAVSIVFVDAQEEVLLDRVASRAQATGRHVPTAFVVDTKRLVRQSVAILQRLTHTAIEIDNSAQPVITSIRANNGGSSTVSINLQVPLRAGSGAVLSYQVEIPAEQLSTDKSVGTADQIKGNKRVLEVKSGAAFDADALEADFLSKLPAQQYWVVVKANDPQAAEIIRRAHRHGFETIALGVEGESGRAIGEMPDYFVVASSERERTRTWDALIANDSENTVEHARLDFARPRASLAEEAGRLNASREQSQSELSDGLRARGIELVGPEELEAKVLRGRRPVLFSGASKKSWAIVSPENQAEVEAAIEASLDMLDPSKVVLVTGATDYGVEKIVHDRARARGFTVLGTMVEHAKASEVGAITHATVMANSWYGKALPVLKWIQQNKGQVIFIGGGEILKDEIQMARDLGAPFALMRGPEGAANDVAKAMPKRSFVGVDGLSGVLYKADPGLFKPDRRKEARDMAVRDYARELRESGSTEPVGYAQLVQHILEGDRRTAILGGYSGLGYEDPAVVRGYVERLVRGTGNVAMYVIGGTDDGIGQAYRWIPEVAAAAGLQTVETAGIVSANAVQYGVAPQDFVVFVDTSLDSWEVVEDGRSLMVAVAAETGGQMVYFKGGEVSAAEIGEALGQGVRVTIVADPRVLPNAAKVARKIVSNPRMVLDGTAAFVANRAAYPTLTVVTGDEPEGSSFPPASSGGAAPAPSGGAAPVPTNGGASAAGQGGNVGGLFDYSGAEEAVPASSDVGGNMFDMGFETYTGPQMLVMPTGLTPVSMLASPPAAAAVGR